DETPGLDQDAQTEWLQDRDQSISVFPGRQDLRGRRTLPPCRRAAFQGVLVADAEAAPNAKELEIVFLRQFRHERNDLPDCLRERRHLGELRADMHLQPAQAQVLQLAGAAVN